MANLELRLSYIIEAPLDCVLNHDFDMDHFPSVHSAFQPRYSLLDSGDNWYEAELRGRTGPLYYRSVIRKTFLNPREVETVSLRGFGRGTVVRDRFVPRNGFTRVERTIRSPRVPRFLWREITRRFLEGVHEDRPMMEGMAEVFAKSPVPYEGANYPFTSAELAEMRARPLDPIRVKCDGCQQVRLTYGLGGRGLCVACWFQAKRKA